MKKRIQKGFIYGVLLLLMGITTACGTDDAQETVAVFYSSIFAKSDQVPAEKRIEQVQSLLSNKNSNSSMTFIAMIIEKAMKEGLTNPFYVADTPSKPQTETRRYVTVRFNQADAKEIFGSNSDYYETVTLEKEGDKWKIIDTKRDNKDTIGTEKIDWIEINPIDYLDY